MSDKKEAKSLSLYNPGRALATRSKKFSKRVNKACKTDCLSLQARRVDLEREHQILADMVTKLLTGEVTDDNERERLMNYSNLLGLKSMIGSMCLLVDTTSEASACKIKQPDGSLKPGKRRFSIAESVSDMREIMIELHEMMDRLASYTYEMARAQKLFVDEHGVDLSQVADKTPEAPEPVDEEIVTTSEGFTDDAEEGENVDLRVAETFVKTGKIEGELHAR